MCSPVGAVVAVASMAQAYSQKLEEESYQKEQRQAAEKQAELERQQAITYAEQEQLGLDQQEQSQMSQLEMDAMREEAKIKAQQANSGIGGITSGLQLGTQDLQSGINKGTLESNFETAGQQLNLEKAGIESNYQSTLNRIKASERKSSGINTALSTGLAGLQGYSVGQSAQNSFKSPKKIKTSNTVGSVAN